MRKKNVNFKINARKSQITNINRNNSCYKFPSPAILESYEEVYPGFTKELIELTKIEQEQKNTNHKNLIKSMGITLRFGQITSFIFSVIILRSSISLYNDNAMIMGAIIFITWFSLLIVLNTKISKLTTNSS